MFSVIICVLALLMFPRRAYGERTKTTFDQRAKTNDAVGYRPEWGGRWFPESPETDRQGPPVGSTHSDSQSLPLWSHLDEMVAMANYNCDDGKHNLTLDAPTDESHFLCSSPKRYFEPNDKLSALLTKYPIPPAFVPSHRCMNETIDYPFPVPTFGPHRPVWAKWGEYDYLPPQRWVHNLEHGGVALLYDPCAHWSLVNRIKDIVRRCFYKHIVTPYKLSSDRPIALVAWGESLAMSTVDADKVVSFIKDRANRGPESIDADGRYDKGLQKPASDYSRLGDLLCATV